MTQSSATDPSTSRRRRLSLPLTAQDERDLELIRTSAEVRSQLPRDLSADASQASIAHAVFEQGMRVIREAQERSAYAQMAEDQNLTSSSRRQRARGRYRGLEGRRGQT